jgi:hypothetical protein
MKKSQLLGLWIHDSCSLAVEHSLIHKTMPKNVKVVVCEIDRLSGDVAHTPVSELCQTRNESR